MMPKIGLKFRHVRVHLLSPSQPSIYYTSLEHGEIQSRPLDGFVSYAHVQNSNQCRFAISNLQIS